MSNRTARLSRRNFLLAASAGGAATAAAIVASKRVPAPADAGDTKRVTSGYQESAHIRNYYRTAKV
jgi:hypothetical protein